MTSHLKGIALTAILALASAFPLSRAEDSAPATPPADQKPAFTLDGLITDGEYPAEKKLEVELWNKDLKAAVYLINSGKYLIAAFDVPDACTPYSSASILIDGKADGNKELANDDAWAKFSPEQIERSRFEQLRGDIGMWDEVEAKGWLARANIMLNRWQCEIVIDLDSFGVKCGNDASARLMLIIANSQKKDVSAVLPVDANLRKPSTWTHAVSVSGADVPGFKIELAPDAVTGLQKKDIAAVEMVDNFIAKTHETQNQYTETVQQLLTDQDKVGKACNQALLDGRKDEADKLLKEYARLARELNKVFTERAQKLAALPAEADKIIDSLGEPRSEIRDIQATLLLNLFQLDISAYTGERGAACANYYLKAFKINPNLIGIEKIALLMNYGCMREASQLAAARLALEPSNQEMRILNMICDMRLGNYKEAAAALEALQKEKIENDQFSQIIAQHLNWIAQAEKIFADEADRLKKDESANLPRVEIDTAKGKIVIELFEDDAPNTVKNFVALVEQKFFDGIVFHRVEPWVIQTGDPEGCGVGGPGYSIKTEANARKSFAGYIGMARSAPDTENSQFYFLRYYTPQLDDMKFTVFGRVIEGMDVLDKIERTDQIKSATVVRKRETTKYEPVKIMPQS
jgi:cyclophilin family peptidyl-prolyl cis-trans isomerase